MADCIYRRTRKEIAGKATRRPHLLCQRKEPFFVSAPFSIDPQFDRRRNVHRAAVVFLDGREIWDVMLT